MLLAQIEVTSQIDLYLVSLSSNTYVFEDKLLVSFTNYFFPCGFKGHSGHINMLISQLNGWATWMCIPFQKSFSHIRTMGG